MEFEGFHDWWYEQGLTLFEQYRQQQGEAGIKFVIPAEHQSDSVQAVLSKLNLERALERARNTDQFIILKMTERVMKLQDFVDRVAACESQVGAHLISEAKDLSNGPRLDLGVS